MSIKFSERSENLCVTNRYWPDAAFAFEFENGTLIARRSAPLQLETGGSPLRGAAKSKIEYFFRNLPIILDSLRFLK